jgi:hypothetical protein
MLGIGTFFLGYYYVSEWGEMRGTFKKDALSPIDFLPERPYSMKSGVKKKCLERCEGLQTLHNQGTRPGSNLVMN